MAAKQGDVRRNVDTGGAVMSARHITILGADGTEIVCEVKQDDGRVQLRFRMGGGVHVQMGPMQLAVAVDAGASVTIDTTSDGARALGQALARLSPVEGDEVMTPAEIKEALEHNASHNPSTMRALARAIGQSDTSVRRYMEGGGGRVGALAAKVLKRD